ncbi:MAG: hypothetical protein HYW47_00955 [Deltaproteobacteria bacterium]|nr:hypothetical protein [Deltaproteobacteria bacterium]
MSHHIDPALFANTFNVIEKAHLLKWLLEKHGLSRLETIENYLPKLKCEAHETVLDYHLELLHVTEDLQKWVVSFDLPLKIAVRLSRLNEENQNVLASLPEKLNLNGNEFKKNFESLEDISLREKKEIKDIIRSLFHETSLSSELGHTANPESITKNTFQRRLFEYENPYLKETQARWRTLKKQIFLDGGIRLKDPQSFEEAYLEFEIKIKGKKDFEKKLETLQKIKDQDSFQKLLDFA